MAGKLNGAAELIVVRGYDETTIDDIAEASGIPKATLYYYFAGKDEIMSFLLNDIVAGMTVAVDVASHTEGQSWDRLVAVVTSQVETLVGHPAVCRVLMTDFGRAGRLPDIVDAVFDGFYGPVERLLTSGALDGTIDGVEDPAVMARIIFGAISFSTLSYLSVGQVVPRAQIVEQTIRLLSTGVRSSSNLR
jgi:AcrR family transcriptional regulator